LAYLLTTTSTAPSTLSSCSQASARNDARSAGRVSSVTTKMRSALVSAARVASSGAEVVSMSTTWWVVSRSFRMASVCSLVSASGPSPGSGTGAAISSRPERWRIIVPCRKTVSSRLVVAMSRSV